MRRAGGLWYRVIAFDNLLEAARRAARGKRARPAVAHFLSRLEPEVLALQRELLDGRYRPRPLVSFILHDPKQRLISVPAFRDRVLHQALIAVCEPVFERRMIHHSYASRKGKGQHAALRQAQRLCRRYAWSLQLDVQHCFESLDHDVVLGTLQRVIKDRLVLSLFDRIVRTGDADGAGLPIGSLTSQWLANLVLDRLDHHVTETLRISGYLRYMDDFVLLANTKHQLSQALVAVRGFLADPLQLRLKERVTRLAPTRTGLPYLGWQVYANTLRLRPQNLRRARARLRSGAGSESHRSVLAHMAHGNTYQLRRSWFG